MSESIFHVVITEEFDGTVPVIERLSMRLDGPLDIPHIVSVLGAKKRAPRSDIGRARKKKPPQKPPQPELLQ